LGGHHNNILMLFIEENCLSHSSVDGLKCHHKVDWGHHTRHVSVLTEEQSLKYLIYRKVLLFGHTDLKSRSLDIYVRAITLMLAHFKYKFCSGK